MKAAQKAGKKVERPGLTSWLERLVLLKLREDTKEREEQKRSEMINSTSSLT